MTLQFREPDYRTDAGRNLFVVVEASSENSLLTLVASLVIAA